MYIYDLLNEYKVVIIIKRIVACCRLWCQRQWASQEGVLKEWTIYLEKETASLSLAFDEVNFHLIG
jgi:hypothetical protein